MSLSDHIIFWSDHNARPGFDSPLDRSFYELRCAGIFPERQMEVGLRAGWISFERLHDLKDASLIIDDINK